MIDDFIFIPDPGGDEPLSLHAFIEEYNPWHVAKFLIGTENYMNYITITENLRI